MHLNVNLTPSPSDISDGASLCSGTPKTPEILNSIISMSAAPTNTCIPINSHKISGELLSPASSVTSITSPIDDFPSPSIGDRSASKTSHSCRRRNRPSSSTSSSSDETWISSTSEAPLAISATSVAFPMTPPAEIPSPLKEMSTSLHAVKATKSALIKEGLKHQIKSKLKAAGVDASKVLKEEKVTCDELTLQDEERRIRRRERNKVAATKCRNKKREKAMILVNESQNVETQNMQLKNEVQRLTSEKQRLVKILEDSKHLLSCKIHRAKPGFVDSKSEQDLVDYLINAAEKDPLSKSDKFLQCSIKTTTECPISVEMNDQFHFPPSVSSIAGDSTPSRASVSCCSFSPSSLPNTSSPLLRRNMSGTPPHYTTHPQSSGETSYSPNMLPDMNDLESINSSTVSSFSKYSSVTSLSHPTNTLTPCSSQNMFNDSCVKTFQSLEAYGISSTIRVCSESIQEYSTNVKELNNNNNNPISLYNLDSKTCPSLNPNLVKESNNQTTDKLTRSATLLSTHTRYSPYHLTNSPPTVYPITLFPLGLLHEPDTEEISPAEFTSQAVFSSSNGDSF